MTGPEDFQGSLSMHPTAFSGAKRGQFYNIGAVLTAVLVYVGGR